MNNNYDYMIIFYRGIRRMLLNSLNGNPVGKLPAGLMRILFHRISRGEYFRLSGVHVAIGCTSDTSRLFSFSEC